MDIINVFFIISVAVAGTAFLSHAIGYRRGIVTGRKQGFKRGAAIAHRMRDIAEGKTPTRVKLENSSDA